MAQNHALASEITDCKDNAHISCFQIKDTFQKVGLFMGNLTLVYFLEYTCVNGWAEAAHPRKETKVGNFFEKNAYVVLQFTYFIGAFISRISVSCF